jgi:hypothetical protein
MNNKIFIVLGVAVLLVAVYLIFFQQKTTSFSDGVKEINSLWEKNNVNPSYLVSGSIAFSSSDLDALNDDLIAFQNSLNELKQTEETEALKDFTEIHLALVEELDLALKIKEKNDLLKTKSITGENMCANKEDLQFVGEKTIALNEKISFVNELIYAFNELHPGLEEKANLTAFLVDSSGFSQAKFDNEIALSELKRLC